MVRVEKRRGRGGEEWRKGKGTLQQLPMLCLPPGSFLPAPRAERDPPSRRTRELRQEDPRDAAAGKLALGARRQQLLGHLPALGEVAGAHQAGRGQVPARELRGSCAGFVSGGFGEGGGWWALEVRWVRILFRAGG